MESLGIGSCRRSEFVIKELSVRAFPSSDKIGGLVSVSYRLDIGYHNEVIYINVNFVYIFLFE